MSGIYDGNNNCLKCDQFRHDQHKRTCPYYVDEPLSEFYKRQQAITCNECGSPHDDDYMEVKA
jgi:hypothetical protein